MNGLFISVDTEKRSDAKGLLAFSTFSTYFRCTCYEASRRILQLNIMHDFFTSARSKNNLFSPRENTRNLRPYVQVDYHIELD